MNIDLTNITDIVVDGVNLTDLGEFDFQLNNQSIWKKIWVVEQTAYTYTETEEYWVPPVTQTTTTGGRVHHSYFYWYPQNSMSSWWTHNGVTSSSNPRGIDGTSYSWITIGGNNWKGENYYDGTTTTTIPGYWDTREITKTSYKDTSHWDYVV